MSRTPDTELRIALPSKGMEEDTLHFLKECGLAVDRTNPRQYRARIPSVPGAAVVFQRAGDIFAKVDEGTVDLGITGYDLVAEHGREDDNVVVLIKDLGYQRCSLSLAVPESWLDVSSIADLAEISGQFHAEGRELQVATKYHHLTRSFLYDHGVNYFSIVDSQGALEAAPAMGYADVICDLVSSGTTLRENRLKMVAGGTVLVSQACLIGNRQELLASQAKMSATRIILEMMEAYLRAREYFSVTANIRGGSELEVARMVTTHAEVAGLRGPTIARVYPKAPEERDWFAVTVVVDGKLLLRAVEALRKAGASEVTATPVKYVFESRCWSYEALQHLLAAGDDGEDRAAPEFSGPPRRGNRR